MRAEAVPASPAPSVAGAGELLRLLRSGEGLTRNELIELTGLSRSTLGARLEALVSAGLVQTSGVGASTGGRPATRLSFCPTAYVVLAADFGATHVTAALTDLAGDVIAETTCELPIAGGPERALGWLVEAADRLLTRTGSTRAQLAGVGIGLPGPVEHVTGVPIKPPIMPGWDGFPVATWVGERLGAPVYVDNDVNMMALGEHASVYPDVDHFVFVKVATGIGAGLISGRRLHRGAVGSAGDLGHVRAPHAPDVLCECGNTGCLEAVASGRAIAAELFPDRPRDNIGTREVLALLEHGDGRATAAVRRAGRDIGEVLATVVNLLNPAVIVIGGSLGAGAPTLMAGIREVVFARSLPLATSQLILVPSRVGAQAAIAGAAVTVVEEFLSPQAVDARLAALDAPA
ncbi:MAG: ROK family transcriptional regulator [Nocardioides sp.]|uniref:ROK family transcriptional regulator n=1 Tax=Nocardioides sp. TaxID=35761 RepID=UPI0032679073